MTAKKKDKPEKGKGIISPEVQQILDQEQQDLAAAADEYFIELNKDTELDLQAAEELEKEQEAQRKYQEEISKLSPLEQKIRFHLEDHPERMKQWEKLKKTKKQDLEEMLMEAVIDEYYAVGAEPPMTLKLLIALHF